MYYITIIYIITLLFIVVNNRKDKKHLFLFKNVKRFVFLHGMLTIVYKGYIINYMQSNAIGVAR